MSNKNTLSDWMLPADFVKSAMENHLVQSQNEMQPCGCGIKQCLRNVVYPAISTHKEYRRVDACIVEGEFDQIKRIIVPLDEFMTPEFSLIKELDGFTPNTVILLFSTETRYLRDPEAAKTEFRNYFEQKVRKLKELNNYLQENNSPPVTFGKGHSIVAGGNFVVFDFLKIKDSKNKFTVANNDTIVTADSLLKTTSPISIHVALNNSFNDLFIHGVYKKLRIRPNFSSKNKADSDYIKQEINEFISFYQSRGVKIELLPGQDCVSEEVDTVGATVIGECDTIPTSLNNLRPHDKIIITKPLGDLSYLAYFRRKFFTEDKVTQSEADLRQEVLQKMTLSNFLIGKCIAQFLPLISEEFDPQKHISVTTDISGPGLHVLEEAAQLSGTDIHIENINFAYPKALQTHRRNYTTSTNGPIVISANEAVINKVTLELKKIGCDEVWQLGHVGKKSDAPKVIVNKDLKKHFEKLNPANDFFNGETIFQDGSIKESPLFNHYEFR